VTLTFRELVADAGDFALLETFYRDLYVVGFPDPNERESLENMQSYLRLKAEGWYGDNSYHILLAVDGDRPVACSISDYLARPNAGVIEFLLVDPRQRGRGVGRRLLDATEDLLQADARRAGPEGLTCIAIEMNDPYRFDPARDNMDPFVRARLWSRWGYGALGFSYVQPALSADQAPVNDLILGAKPLQPCLRHGFPPALVRDIVAGYLRWAMRIDDPACDPTFQRMAADLAARRRVPWTPFEIYLGHDPARPLHVREIPTTSDPDFPPTMRLYRRSFPAGPTAIGEAAFAAALGGTLHEGRYHLWAVREFAESPLAGMASFFTFPAGGFVGYVALEPPLRGRWRLPLLLARLEEQMVRDCGPVIGWFFETARTDTSPTALSRLGFYHLPVDYVSPPHVALGGTDAGEQALSLYFKHLGRADQPLTLTKSQLLAAAESWLSNVYGLPEPRTTVTWIRLQKSLQHLSDDQLISTEPTKGRP